MMIPDARNEEKIVDRQVILAWQISDHFVHPFVDLNGEKPLYCKYHPKDLGLGCHRWREYFGCSEAALNPDREV